MLLNRFALLVTAALAIVATDATDARAQIPRGADVRPSETVDDNCAKVVERAIAERAITSDAPAKTPIINGIRVIGANRTPTELVVERSGLEPGQPLTTAALRRAARRTLDLPVASCGWISYFPQDNGRTTVELGIRERPRFPTKWASWGETAGRALFMSEIEIPMAGWTDYGERLDLEYAWKSERPRWAVRLSAPAPGPVPGLVVGEVAWTRHAFSVPAGVGSEVFRQERQSVRLGFEDWIIERLHWHVDGSYDRIHGLPFVALGGGVDTRWFGDRVAVRLESSSWTGTDDALGFRSSSISAHWRQRVSAMPVGWSAEVGSAMVSDQAPIILWPAADVGSTREAFLRGHRVLTSGVVTGDAFGRRLAFGSVTYECHVKETKFGTVGLVGFVDSVRAWDGPFLDRPRAHTDIGLGARFHSEKFGSLRLDVGYGLRDGNIEISTGFVKPWPRR